MAVVQNVEKHIEHTEGFEVRILHLTGRDVRSDRSGLPQYPFFNPCEGNMTVESWKSFRFRRAYPGFEVDVLDSQGHTAHGNMKLNTVRETYVQ